MKILRKKRFVKSYMQAPRYIQDKADDVLIKFSEYPLDTSLRNHALKGKFQGVRSMNITGDRRIIFKELSDGKYELVELIDIGTHSQLYGK